MTMKNKIFIIGFVSIAMFLGACNKFLDVKPETSLAEEEFFTSEQGFTQALNGSYSQLATRNLYTDKLSMGYVSALAQNYNITYARSVDLLETAKLNYPSAEAEGHASSIWSTAYTAIAGLNKILDNTMLNRKVLNENNSYAIIRGESLALRALLHFDLYRLFGKEFQANKNVKAIPYKTEVSELAKVPATSAEVFQFLLADLKEAEDLLKPVDPIVTTTTSTNARRSHMNYYGVKALEARVRITMGDKAGAAAAANVVISSAKFPFVTKEAVSNAANPDHLYLTEQVFMIRSADMRTYTETYFRGTSSTNDSKLTLPEANLKSWFEASGSAPTDYRWVYGVAPDLGMLLPTKFLQSSSTSMTDDRLDAYVPVIRLSEMYYILAEAAATPEEGMGILNAVREARGLTAKDTNLTQAQFSAELLKEYQKEFYAEGQLFFYYKRTNATTMLFKTGTATMTPAMYVVPIPDAELQFNPNY